MKIYIARDEETSYCRLFSSKPEKRYSAYYEKFIWTTDMPNDGIQLELYAFPEVTFENSPMEVELVIKSQNKVTECHNCHEVIKFTENDVIDGWYVKCPCCEEEISILL